MSHRTEHGVSQYPDWKCKSCGKEYPFDTTTIRCNQKRGQSLCRGPLHRYIKYEVKQPGVRYENVPPNRRIGH
jgi:hypothetical protein